MKERNIRQRNKCETVSFDCYEWYEFIVLSRSLCFVFFAYPPLSRDMHSNNLHFQFNDIECANRRWWFTHLQHRCITAVRILCMLCYNFYVLFATMKDTLHIQSVETTKSREYHRGICAGGAMENYEIQRASKATWSSQQQKNQNERTHSKSYVMQSAMLAKHITILNCFLRFITICRYFLAREMGVRWYPPATKTILYILIRHKFKGGHCV